MNVVNHVGHKVDFKIRIPKRGALEKYHFFFKSQDNLINFTKVIINKLN